MSNSAYLLYESQQEIDSHTFYKLRVAIIPDVYEYLIDFLLFTIGSSVPLELSLLDLPFIIPSMVSSGTELNNWSGAGSYTLTENIYFAYAKGLPNIHALKDIDTPDSDDIVIVQAFFGDTEVWYCDIAPGSIDTWPSGDDPDDVEPDGNGWLYPDALEDWGYYEDTDVASRTLDPWYISDVWLKNIFIWFGCDEEDEDHFLNNAPTSFLSNRWRYDPLKYIYCCHEEDSSYIYWIERETIGSTESISVWKFQSNENAYYYPHLDFSEATPGISPDVLHVPALDLLNLLDINVPAMQGGVWKLTQVANLYAKYQFRGITSNDKGIASNNKGVAIRQ